MSESQTAPGWLGTFAQFAAWLVASLVAVVDALYIREAVISVMRALQTINYNKLHEQGFTGQNLQFGFAITTTANLMAFVVGAGAVAFTVWVEYYFRKGRAQGLMWKRIGIVLAVQIALIVLMILIMAISGA